MAGAKAKSASYHLVIPINNVRFQIPTEIPISLSDKIALRQIRPEDLATITANEKFNQGSLKGSTYTITIDDYDLDGSCSETLKSILSAVFSLNVFSFEGALSLDSAFLIRSLRKRSVDDRKDLPHHHHGNKNGFKIGKASNLSSAENLFASVNTAINKHKTLQLTLSRFNSSLGRSSPQDRLIDLCIALESVFQSQSEITFQFSLFNSLLAETDPQKRYEIFRKLKKLYSQRSQLVHGSSDLDQAWFDEAWPSLVAIAKAAILGKVEFLVENTHEEWKTHLEHLALGM